MAAQIFYWEDNGTQPPVGEAKYVAGTQVYAEDVNWAFKSVETDFAVLFAFLNSYDANTILKADVDDTPIPLTVGEQTVVGRKTGGSIDALAIGIADDDIVQIDHGAVADDDYAKFTANGLEGRSYAELRSDVGVIFEESGNVIREHSDGGYDNDFVIGSPALADSGAAYDERMWFDKSKGAFRAGKVTGTEWNDANIGTCSFAEGRNTIASGGYAHAEGGYTTASGASSHAEGEHTIANGQFAHAEGYYTTASGFYSHAEGGWTIASNYGSHAEGVYSNAYLYRQHAKASGRFAATGDAQLSNLVARIETTDATAGVETFLDGSSERAILPSNRTWTFTIKVSARENATGDSAGFIFEGVIERTGANTRIVGSPTKNVLARDNAAWDVTAVADNTNEALVVKVTGEAGKTIHWVAAINLVEVG